VGFGVSPLILHPEDCIHVGDLRLVLRGCQRQCHRLRDHLHLRGLLTGGDVAALGGPDEPHVGPCRQGAQQPRQQRAGNQQGIRPRAFSLEYYHRDLLPWIMDLVMNDSNKKS
jgi:hypothetical protein